ncbi:hypothetical protein ANCDUO_10140 [Ancylostoma duodenale]|uniref:Uncharacterized protein n=1 Tax=Ancylostoma duodenale TaxID=51022 RepID=A0A0C2GEN0_9BILA|nr:hypothetical protein ANCDUO_10140 [Ancylostoma duodenale]
MTLFASLLLAKNLSKPSKPSKPPKPPKPPNPSEPPKSLPPLVPGFDVTTIGGLGAGVVTLGCGLTGAAVVAHCQLGIGPGLPSDTKRIILKSLL